MATNPYADFDRDLKLITAEVEPEILRRELAAFAKRSLAEAIASGEASPMYDRYVNDRLGAPEESVQLPGPIVYVFSNWSVILKEALAELERRAPRRSGKFQQSFIVLVNQQIVTDFSRIAPDAEVIITNAQPYVRKVETGVLKVPRYYVFDGTKNFLVRRFGGSQGSFSFVTRWLNITGGVHPLIPYVLKGSQGKRKDRQAGMPITYPAIVIKPN
jgi:hypothetical protein